VVVVGVTVKLGLDVGMEVGVGVAHGSDETLHLFSKEHHPQFGIMLQAVPFRTEEHTLLTQTPSLLQYSCEEHLALS
jgi:hypothetical protein